jgi:ketosteroid isomerase-like protein
MVSDNREIVMTAAHNKELIRRAFLGLAQGDNRPYWSLVDEDFTFTIVSGSWARRIVGRDAVVAELFTPLRAQFADRQTIQATNIVAEGDTVVVEARGCVTTKRGDLYANLYCLIFELKDGRLKSCKEYADTALVDRVLDPPAWARLPESAPAD